MIPRGLGLFRPGCLFFALVFALACLPASGQLRLGAELDRDRYLVFEPIRLKVTIQNNSGNDLVFNHALSEEAHLSLLCKKSKEPYAKTAVINTGSDGAFRLAAGQRRELQATLNNLFELHAEGDYEIYAQVGHPQLETDFRSETLDFEVREGEVLWTAQVGVPANPLDPGGAPIRTRRASVLGFSGKNVDHYAVRIEDERRVYAIHRVGRRISSEKPVCDVDGRSNLHILLRMSSRVFVYRIYDCRGRLLQTKLLAASEEESPPLLVRDRETGIVRTVGGRPARQGEDYQILEDGQLTTPE